MPRLPELLDRGALPAADAAVFDYLAGTRGRVGLPFSVLLNSAPACQVVAAVGTYVRFESGLPKHVIELATITAAREADCAFEWAAHAPAARSAGVSEAAIEAVANHGAIDGLDAQEALVVRIGRDIAQKHRVADADFAAARERFGPKGVVDLITTMGYYAMLASLINALEVAPAPDAEKLP